MATATQNDASDLLILSDEPTTLLDENPIIDENMDTTADLISFDDDLDLTQTADSPKAEVKEETGLDMGLDLTQTAEAPKVEVKEETGLDMGLDLTQTAEASKAEVKEETGLDMGLDLTETAEVPKAEVKEEVEIKEVFNLEKATELYVSQLEDRKKQIASDIGDDEKIISIKEEKIKNLKSEIADYRKSIRELNSESAAIDEKISLVTGKNKVNEIKTKTTTRVHNVKRKKAS